MDDDASVAALEVLVIDVPLTLPTDVSLMMPLISLIGLQLVPRGKITPVFFFIP